MDGSIGAAAIRDFIPWAVIHRPPAFFASRGVEFQTGCDDLDYYQAAELSLPDGRRFALMHYRGMAGDETMVCLPAATGVEDAPPLVQMIAARFDLPPAALAWQRVRGDAPS